MFDFLSKVSLSSWDEAWYGVIANNIVKSGDIFNLTFNSRPFFDHPPFVMWLQALLIKFVGASALAVRLPSFVLAAGTVIALYLLGKEIFGKFAGIFSAVALVFSPWFLTRAMSGNLDIALTFFFVLTFYLTLKSVNNSKFLVWLAVSLSFLILTKSLVPLTIIPVVVYLLWGKVKLKSIIYPLIIFCVLTMPWFVINYINNPSLIQKYLSIGYPGASTKTNLIDNIMLTKTYLHNGIGNIFIYGLFSLPLGLMFYRKKYIPLIIFISIFLIPFAFSNKGHIWHLIPLYPFWILSFFGLLELITKKYKYIILPLVFVLVMFNQIKKDWYEILITPKYVSDMEILSRKSSEYNYPLVLDDDAVPEVLFYSGKDQVQRTSGRGDLRTRFDSKDQFLLITREWRLSEEKINQKEYTFIAGDRDKILILKK